MLELSHPVRRGLTLGIGVLCSLLAGCANDRTNQGGGGGGGGTDARVADASNADAGSGDATGADAGSGDASSADAGSGDAALADAWPAQPDAGMTMRCNATAAPCQDQQIAQLLLRTAPNLATITEEGVIPGEYSTLIDATAGGLNTPLGFVYVRFTAAGLVRVDLGDEDALESTDWDLAIRRYVIRLNSGVSGPSCVVGARTAPGTSFDSLTAPANDLIYRTEEYFTPGTCEFVPDTSGIGAPGSALASFWTYPGCVAMTGNIYVIQLADGHHVKLEVLSYYFPNVQDTCNRTGAVPTPSGGGNIRIRWAMLD